MHVAAHGTHQQESPLFSSLRVADGPLYAYELDAGDRPAPCVVLSACEAGLSTVRPGDEGLGPDQRAAAPRAPARCSPAWPGSATTSPPGSWSRCTPPMARGTDSAAALAEALAEEAEPAPFVAFGATW